MHDAAIARLGHQGLVRLSATHLRHPGNWPTRGQSSDPSASSYSRRTASRFFPGYIEVVRPGDPIGGGAVEHVGKIKVKAWRGTNFVADPTADTAGVDWILAERWVRLPAPDLRDARRLRDYVSGHLDVFRAARGSADGASTGSEYFPGGMTPNSRFPPMTSWFSNAGPALT